MRARQTIRQIYKNDKQNNAKEHIKVITVKVKGCNQNPQKIAMCMVPDI